MILPAILSAIKEYAGTTQVQLLKSSNPLFPRKIQVVWDMEVPLDEWLGKAEPTKLSEAPNETKDETKGETK